VKKERAIVTQLNDYEVKYDFSSCRIVSRIRMAVAIILKGRFIFKGKEKNQTNYE